MTGKENIRISELLIKIGQRIGQDPKFLSKLEAFVIGSENLDRKEPVNMAKINAIDLFQLIRVETEETLYSMLSELNLYELKALLKKYRFGSPSKFKNSDQIKTYIVNQLRQRKTDVFQSTEA